VSLADPDARPIRKGKLGKPTEFGYVAQICEVTETTRKGARGFILPASHAPGNPTENRLLPQTAGELDRAGIRLREIVVDGGFTPGPTKDAFPALTDAHISSPAATNPAPDAPANAERATAPASKAASATSNAATDYAAPDSKATTGCEPGPAGRSCSGPGSPDTPVGEGGDHVMAA